VVYGVLSQDSQILSDSPIGSGTWGRRTTKLFRDQLVVLGLGGAHTPGEVLRQTIGAIGQITAGAVASGSLFASGRLLYGHCGLVAGFLKTLLEGGPPPVSGEEGLRTIALLEAICGEAKLSPSSRPA
jgi:hypothetical protein